MAWVETESPSFSARHEADDEEAAGDTLTALEDYRSELQPLFEKLPRDVAVVMHSHPAALAMAHPWLPLYYAQEVLSWLLDNTYHQPTFSFLLHTKVRVSPRFNAVTVKSGKVNLSYCKPELLKVTTTGCSAVYTILSAMACT